MTPVALKVETVGIDAAAAVAEALDLPRCVADVLVARGYATVDAARRFLEPSLDDLESLEGYTDLPPATERLLRAVRSEERIAIYADRDVDGLTGLTIMARSLRALGAVTDPVCSPGGRGIDVATLDALVARKPKILIFVDIGAAETAILDRLTAAGIDVIIADHHRLQGGAPSTAGPGQLWWVHPGHSSATTVGAPASAPAGCVMAFTLARSLWRAFLGDDRERLDYFLYEHADLAALGILADRVPVTGDNRTLVVHGLRRLANSRKMGLSSMLRFFRLAPRIGPITTHEASWQIIPLLNAAGRLGCAERAACLLMSEDIDEARSCIDELLALNARRRDAQSKSVEEFDRAVAEQCTPDADAIIVALAEGLEPSVTGLAAQALQQRYGKPVFLFVSKGEEIVGSGRSPDGHDLFVFIERHQDLIIRFGGHAGAVGMTVKTSNFALFRERLMSEPPPGRARSEFPDRHEAEVSIAEISEAWWRRLALLGPFGPGNPPPLFRLQERVKVSRAPSKGGIVLSAGTYQRPAVWEVDASWETEGEWIVDVAAQECRRGEGPFRLRVVHAIKV